MMASNDSLSFVPYVFAGMLLVVGGIVVGLQVLRKPSPFPFLVDRGIDPHLWGFNLLGAGFLLSLVLMMLRRTPWSRETLMHRAILGAAVVWMAVAIAMSIVAVLTRSRAGASVSLFPAVDAKPAAWPGAYRVFLILGFAALFTLGIMAF